MKIVKIVWLLGATVIIAFAPSAFAENVAAKKVKVDPAVAVLAAYAQLQTAAGKSNAAPVVDAKGALRVPEGYRSNYEFLGSWAIATDDKGLKGSKEMHSVYASPGAVAGYIKSGHFPDGTVLVKEVFAATTSEMTTGTVSHEEKLKGWFVMVRDSKNTHPGNKLWGDGWGWSWFDADNQVKTTSTDYTSDCQGCHIPAKANDWIYVQGYPSLKR